MDENTFLKAQNLKNQISELENWIDSTKQHNAKIGVWAIQNIYPPEFHTDLSTTLSNLNNSQCIKSYSTKELPGDISTKVIQLVNDEIKRLKEEFESL